MDNVNTELKELTLCDQLRANSSFMKIMATLFHYGNQPMNAAQLVVAVRALDLLPLRGETPKSTIQGIISTSRKTARDLKKPDPFEIQKDSSGRQARYCISQSVLGDATVPPPLEIPDEPIILKPVEHSSSYSSSYAAQLGKRQRKMPKFYTPDAMRKASRRRKAAKKRRQSGYGVSDDGSEVDVDMDDDSDLGSVGSSDEESVGSTPVEEDTINHYSLLYAPPTADMNYIDSINFEEYPIASYFAIAQQKGYSYPRFRSHEKVKIPKVHCEDKFRVADIVSPNKKRVVGRMFILADGHGGRGCSEFFVRKTPAALQDLCAKYNIDTFADKEVQKQFEKDIKQMVETLDEQYLEIKRVQLGRIADNNGKDSMKVDQVEDAKGDQKQQQDGGNATPDDQNPEEKDNDGCTLIINIFLGNWLINVNVGDSRSVLISAPEPSSTESKSPPVSLNDIGPLGLDNDYKMDVVFASQDHKPYLEHLAREILENGGEFVDSVQDRVIKVDLDKLREDGNRQAKRIALKNARIRPKDYTPHDDGTKANNSFIRPRTRDSRIPSLNVARSCGDLDFKMNREKKIISCEPDVTFIRISDDNSTDQRTLVTSGPHKSKRRHFLFMSTDGMFDYMYEDTPERQNRAVARVMGPMIEDGEKSGGLLLQDEEKSGGQTIDHTQETEEKKQDQETAQENGKESNTIKDAKNKKEEEDKKEEMAIDKSQETVQTDTRVEDKNNSTEISGEKKAEETKPEETEQPRVPLLFRELNEEETRTRKIKERTLAMAARYFANREGLHGFFASTLQDYDDCTIVLIEI